MYCLFAREGNEKLVCVKQNNRGPGKGKSCSWPCTINPNLFSWRKKKRGGDRTERNSAKHTEECCLNAMCCSSVV